MTHQGIAELASGSVFAEACSAASEAKPRIRGGLVRVTPLLQARQLSVLRVIRDRGTITRAEIGRVLGLSFSQVSRLTSSLIESGWVEVDRRLASVDGRPAELLTLARSTYCVVGLDIGGEFQQAVTVNLRGEVVATVEARKSLHGGRASLLEHVEELVTEVLRCAEVSADHVLGLGVGLRAVVDPGRGVITGGPEAPGWSAEWTEFPVRDELARILPWQQIIVDDTVRVLGVAEARYGYGRGESDFVYLFADTGIGSAVMIGRHPYVGPAGIAGEIGHVILDPDGDVCGCGRRGCIETKASSSAILRRASLLLGESAPAMEDVIRRADDGDAAMRRLLIEGGMALGRGIGIMLNLLGPRLIVIGGSAAGSDCYLEATIRSAREAALPQMVAETRIVRSELGPWAGARGAATLVLDAALDLSTGSVAGRSRRRSADGQPWTAKTSAESELRGGS